MGSGICVQEEQEYDDIRDQGMEGEGPKSMDVEPEGQRP